MNGYSTCRERVERLKLAARSDAQVGDALHELRLAQEAGDRVRADVAYARLYARLDQVLLPHDRILRCTRVDATIVSRSLP